MMISQANYKISKSKTFADPPEAESVDTFPDWKI